MEDQSQSLSWADLLSWNGVGWDVALLIGVWGALLGIGHYFLADLFFILAVLLFCLKWGHFTNIFTPRRRTGLFSIGISFALILTLGTIVWTSKQAKEAWEEKQKLSQLDLIPGLQQQINDLKKQNTESSTDISKKQSTIEGLAAVVIAQQQTIAESAHKDLVTTATTLSGQVQKTEATLATNINQYRNDTTSAVSKIMRPPRSLGDKRAVLVEILKKQGPHEIAITPAHGSEEALAFANEIESAFTEAGWKIVRTKKYVFMIRDGIGLEIITKIFSGNEPSIKWADLTPEQSVVGQAFQAIGFPLQANAQTGGDTGPTELYVGLQ